MRTGHERPPPGSLCFYECGRPATTWDHFLPRSRIGEPYPTPPPKRLNKLPACEPCNTSKGAKHPRDWLEHCPPAAVPKILARLEELTPWFRD